MSDYNMKHNRAVWFDIPVSDLDRAMLFYSSVLKIGVTKEHFGDIVFGLIEHGEGNGGCLVLRESEIASQSGILLYFNVDGRIKDAMAQVTDHGGKVVEPIHSIGPHGFRAIVLDSEGNRIALHSNQDV